MMKRRILASDEAEAGRAVSMGFTYSIGSQGVPGGRLSQERAQTLRDEIWDIDTAQHAALASGDRYYLGAPPSQP